MTLTKFKTYEKQAYVRFRKALEKKGYLSLRSIIESQYRLPQTYIIEPIRKFNINPHINSPHLESTSQQPLTWQRHRRPEAKVRSATRIIQLQKKLGAAVHQLSKHEA